MARTDTAHQVWEENWKSEEARADWLTPDETVEATLPMLHARGVQDVLDLGAGIGRHAILFARAGFRVSAVDGSRSGLAEIDRVAKEGRVAIRTLHGYMTELPLDTASIDHVLSFNVIYHGDEQIVRQSIAEICRVLRPGGTVQVTMLSKRNANYGVGEEISADTFVRADAADDKAHPHFYCSAGELVGLFEGFEVLSLEDRLHRKPGSWHWHLTAEKVGDR